MYHWFKVWLWRLILDYRVASLSFRLDDFRVFLRLIRVMQNLWPGGFLSHGGTPSLHPCYFQIFHCKPSSYWGILHVWKPPYFLPIDIVIWEHLPMLYFYWGSPMTMENPTWLNLQVPFPEELSPQRWTGLLRQGARQNLRKADGWVGDFIGVERV